jgi:hypothetical protein
LPNEHKRLKKKGNDKKLLVLIEKPWKGKQENWPGEKDPQELMVDVSISSCLKCVLFSLLPAVQTRTGTLTVIEIVTGEETVLEEEIETDREVAPGKTELLGVVSRTSQPHLAQNVRKQLLPPKILQWPHPTPLPCRLHHFPPFPMLLFLTHPWAQRVTSFP